MALEFRNVGYVYDRDSTLAAHALSDINLTIEDGVFYGLIGHTGSGKSTLTQLMNGLLEPTSGEIYIDGMSYVDKGMDMRRLRSRVGLVFQYPEHQLFETTVYDDVSFGPKNMKLSADEIEERVREALKRVGVAEKYWRLSPFELSGGQKRRVAIAGVLAMKPEILVLDEPTAGLDPRGRDMILNRISMLHEEEHMTVILVSHSMEDVARYVDRIIVMNRGRIEYNDVPSEVFRHVDRLEQMGLSAPQVTYVLMKLKNAGMDVATDITTISEAAAEIERALKR